jgi:mannose-6-phosphate isomerase-like protein (cupin superfamily)
MIGERVSPSYYRTQRCTITATSMSLSTKLFPGLGGRTGGLVTERFDTMRLTAGPDVVAPDGSNVRVLLRLDRGSMARFELDAGRVSAAVAHRRVDEIWYILAGSGEMWRQQGDRAEIVPLAAGTCLSIPVGTRFQFRAFGAAPLAAVGVTMPPWPGENEAYQVCGPWSAT